MGLIQKKDEDRDLEFVDGVEVIGRGEGPDDAEDEPQIELHEGLTAEDISGKRAAEEAERELEADPELLGDVEDEDEGAEDARPADEDSADEDAADLDTDVEADADKDAPVKEAADQTSGHAAPEAPKAAGGRHKLYIAGAVVAVVAAGVIGYFAGSGGFGAKGLGSATISEDQLGTAVASFSFNGATESITAREALESQYSLDAVKSDEGTYPAPAADTVLAYARNQVLLKEAERQDMGVDDDELSAIALDTLGVDDFSAIAEQYQVSEDQAKDIVREQAMIQKLYQSVVKDAPATSPTAPTEPENGDENTASAEYAAYIIDLAGDEWDAEKGTWASEDGMMAQALAGETFTADSATYAQAQKAYAAAYQQYMIAAQEAGETWTEFANKLFAKANVELYGLFA